MSSSSKLRDRVGIDPVIFGMRANELYKNGLPMEIEGCDQTIVASGNLEANPICPKRHCLAENTANILQLTPLSLTHCHDPVLDRRSSVGMFSGIFMQMKCLDYPHANFPFWEK
ncbi:hypothetical protein [Martelella radicis]|uniref:Uncharacterized protein n=1 Tax=Martelella radicis TaxID=1397476 RepID=A0A7W6PAA5_9HYPH|nr:hypothetical protein [Martelella radicis]